ncbi:hypothetical protein HPB49_016074 [Dermacentor silvarum]|uniref:Uncharacterized protein n=1 Tax=Dermacentor silvarum TaxID=543639 RepID=A0ACB8CFY0_DERSI|nr:hypothetical protein HPB49_016074 [Dermacentor silvarum]
MPAKQKRKSTKQRRKAAAVTHTRTAGPLQLQKEKDTLLCLPDDVLVAILKLLDWKCRITMGSLCRRLKNVVNDAPWMRCARFTLQDPPTVFTAVMVMPRTDVITELDVSFYVLAKSERVAEALSLCTNLVVLHCVHSRIRPTTMVLLLKDKLRKLECLHWSVLKDTTADIEVPDFLARNSEGSSHCHCSVLPPHLKTMYVEVVSTTANHKFIFSVLRHCHALMSLHFHERESESTCLKSSEVTRVLLCYREGTRDYFDNFTYTADRTTSANVKLPKKFVMLRVFDDYGWCYEVSNSVTLRLRPTSTRNFVTLPELHSTSPKDAMCHTQLTVSIKECRNDAVTRLNDWLCRGKWRHLKALTLLSLHKTAALFSCNRRNQVALCNFIRSCVALTELNLSAFHFSQEFDWSSMLATGNLHNLRSLALAACALCCPKRLQFIGRASFKLRELDVRSFPPTELTLHCDVCRRDATCDDVALAPLRRLEHLEHLTLCEMPHVRSLTFLLGCTSIRELRLRNLGVWSTYKGQDMTPIVSIWPQLRALKLGSATSMIDLSIFVKLPVSPLMKRICLALVSFDDEDIVELDVIDVVQRVCPAVDVVHVHMRYPLTGKERTFFPRGPLLLADDAPDHTDPAWLPTADKVWLCDCSNYIGLTAPHGVKKFNFS